jgi:hypothetical protein
MAPSASWHLGMWSSRSSAATLNWVGVARHGREFNTVGPFVGQGKGGQGVRCLTATTRDVILYVLRQTREMARIPSVKLAPRCAINPTGYFDAAALECSPIATSFG